MDETADSTRGLSVFGGPYSQWRAWLDTEQEAARQAERAAAQARPRREAPAHRGRDEARHGAADRKARSERAPKILANDRSV